MLFSLLSYDLFIDLLISGLNTIELKPKIIQPVINFPFTIDGKQNRKFYPDWYTIHPNWLEYSISSDNVTTHFCRFCHFCDFCRFCRIF